MAAPETMDELVASLERLHRASAGKVLATLSTRPFMDLPTHQRTVAAAYMSMTLAAAMDLVNIAPENQQPAMAWQTDQWYRTHDVDGIFANLTAYIQRASVMSR